MKDNVQVGWSNVETAGNGCTSHQGPLKHASVIKVLIVDMAE